MTWDLTFVAQNAASYDVRWNVFHLAQQRQYVLFEVYVLFSVLSKNELGVNKQNGQSPFADPGLEGDQWAYVNVVRIYNKYYYNLIITSESYISRGIIQTIPSILVLKCYFTTPLCHLVSKNLAVPDTRTHYVLYVRRPWYFLTICLNWYSSFGVRLSEILFDYSCHFFGKAFNTALMSVLS